MITAIIIDDEAKGRLALREKLSAYCTQVNVIAEASNGQEALLLIQHHKPQLIFLDIEMPRMNGFEMLNALPEKNFHVIFTTAYDQYAIKAIKYAAFDYLLKPIDIEELKTAVLKADTAENESAQNVTSVLWHTIDDEFFSSAESEPIDLYTASLLDKGISSEQINTKQKLAKIIIKQYRNQERDLHRYRKIIDKTQHLFSRQDLQEFFLVVSREFHSYWLMVKQAE